jgi:hypothetical protein
MFLGNLLKDVGGLVNGAVSGVEHFFGGGQPAPRPQAPQAPQQAPQAIRAPQQAPAPQGVNLGQLSDMINKSTGFQTFADRQKQQNQFINQPAQPAKPINFNNVVNNAGNQFLKNTPSFNVANTIAKGAMNPNVQRGVANSVAGAVVQPLVGAGELFNRDINAPVQASIQSVGNFLQSKPDNWAENYNKAADTLTNSLANTAQAIDQKTGTNISGSVNSAYEHPLSTAIMTGLTAAGPLLGPEAGAFGKAGQTITKVGFGGQAALSIPSTIQAINNAKTPDERTQAVTEAFANGVFAAGLLGSGGKDIIKGIKDPYTQLAIQNGIERAKQINANLGEEGKISLGQPGEPQVGKTPQTPEFNIPKKLQALEGHLNKKGFTVADLPEDVNDKAKWQSSELPIIKEYYKYIKDNKLNPDNLGIKGVTRTPQAGKTPTDIKLRDTLNKLDDNTLRTSLETLKNSGAENSPAYKVGKEILDNRTPQQTASNLVVGSKEWNDYYAKQNAPTIEKPKVTLQEGRANQVLDKKIRYNGQVMTRSEYVDALKNDGYTPTQHTVNGKQTYALKSPKGDYYDISKIEYTYASTPTPQVGKPIVKFKQATQKEQLASLGLSEIPKPTAELPVNNPIENKYIDANQQAKAPDVVTQQAIDRAKTATNNPLYNSINLPKAAEGDINQAVLNYQGVTKGIQDRLTVAVDTANLLDAHDKALLDKLRTKDPEVVAKKAHNETQFLAAAQHAKEYNDYTQELGRSQGQDLGYRKNYGAAVFYDLNDEKTASILADRQAKLKRNPNYAKGRSIPDYEEGAKLNLKRKNSNFIEDLQDDAKRRTNDLGDLAFANTLRQALPGLVQENAIGIGKQGNYVQIKIPGTNRLTSLTVPKEFADKINQRASYEYGPGKGGKALKTYDSANAVMKFFDLALGGYHSVQEAAGFIPERFSKGDFLGTARGMGVIFSPKLFKDETVRMSSDQASHADGMSTLDRANVSGLTRMSKQIGADADTALKLLDTGKYNPIRAVHDSLFGREIPYFKLRSFETRTKNLDFSKPEDVLEARQIAKALNSAYGGINRAIDGLTPTQLKLASRGILATDYNEGLARSWVNALSKRNVEGDLARRVVIGRRLLLAAPGIISYVMANPNASPQQIASNIGQQFFTPNVPSPFKTKSGISKVINFPKDVSGKVITMATPFFDQNNPNKLSGIATELSGNLSSLPATVPKLVTNQDYYGNPIITNNLVQSAANIGTLVGPIAGQNITKVVTGQMSAAEAAINTLGGRTASDPNDPKFQATQAYYKAISMAGAQVQGADKGLVASYFARQKDPNTGQTIQEGPRTAAANAKMLFANDSVRNAIQKAQQSIPNHDPLWDLSSDQLKTYENYKTLPPGGADAEVMKANNPWIGTLATTRSNFFNSNNFKSTSIPDPKDPPVQYPLSSQENSLIAQAGKITDAAQKNQFYTDNPQLSIIENKYGQYVNQERAAQGLQPLPVTPLPTAQQAQELKEYAQVPKGGGSKGGNKYQAVYLQAHPDLSNYFAQSTFNSLLRQAAINDAGGGSSQQLLKDIKNVGTYDITKNPDGSYSFGTSSSSSGSGSSSSSSSGSSSGSSSNIRLRLPNPTNNKPLRAKISFSKRMKFKVNKTNIQRPQAVAGRVQTKLQTPRANNKGATVKSKSDLVKSSS